MENDFENLRYASGSNDKRIGENDSVELFVDALDVGLLGQVEPHYSSKLFRGSSQGRKIYHENNALWNDIFSRELRHGDSITLKNFLITEWIPSSPGRYFTAKAGDSDELDHYVPEQTDHLFRAKLTT